MDIESMYKIMYDRIITIFKKAKIFKIWKLFNHKFESLCLSIFIKLLIKSFAQNDIPIKKRKTIRRGVVIINDIIV